MKAFKDLISDTPEVVLRKVYSDNFSWLENYVRRNSGNLEDAQDIFQESICVAWLNLKEGRFIGNSEQFNAYVRQICKYKWINQLKSAVYTKMRLEEDLSAYDQGEDTMQVYEMQLEESRLLRECFEGLGTKCREVLGKYYYQRQSLATIAGAMDNTEESIKTIKYRCMMKLRKLYLEKHKSDE